MAFLVAGAVRLGVKAVKQGVAAHRDAQDLDAASERPVEYDRWGNEKKRGGPVYDLVMKVEGKGKGRAEGGAGTSPAVSQSSINDLPQRRGSTDKKEPESGGGEDYGPQDWDAKRQREEAPPPAYEQAVTAPLDQPRSGFGTLPPHLAHPSNSSLPRAGLIASQPNNPRSKSSSSSSSSSSSLSDEGNHSQYKGLDRKERKALRKANRTQSREQRKADKAERRALKAQHRADRATLKAEQRGARAAGSSSQLVGGAAV